MRPGATRAASPDSRCRAPPRALLVLLLLALAAPARAEVVTLFVDPTQSFLEVGSGSGLSFELGPPFVGFFVPFEGTGEGGATLPDGTVSDGLRTSLGGISVFVRQAARVMSDDQMRALVAAIEDMIVEVHETPEIPREEE